MRKRRISETLEQSSGASQTIDPEEDMTAEQAEALHVRKAKVQEALTQLERALESTMAVAEEVPPTRQEGESERQYRQRNQGLIAMRKVMQAKSAMLTLKDSIRTY